MCSFYYLSFSNVIMYKRLVVIIKVMMIKNHHYDSCDSGASGENERVV